jgi:hypothetical protein
MAIPSYKGITWVSELSEAAQTQLMNKQRENLKNAGIYSEEEIEMYVADLENEKLANIIDVFGRSYILNLIG